MVGAYIGGKSVVELEEKEWDLMITLNLKSAFLISKHVTRQMILSKSGKIIHISSRIGLHSEGYDSAYSASKSGLIRLVESLAEETKESNINVNCIMPSIIDTQSNRKAMPNADFNKWVEPEDLANVILFLCSEEAKNYNRCCYTYFWSSLNLLLPFYYLVRLWYTFVTKSFGTKSSGFMTV